MAVDPFAGFEQKRKKDAKKEARKKDIKSLIKTLIIGVLLVNIVLSIPLTYELVNRSTIIELEEFNDLLGEKDYRDNDVIYVKFFAYKIEGGEKFFAVADREEESGIFGIVLFPADRIYMHNHFRENIVEGETYICEVKIFRYSTKWHDPDEFSISYRVREVYLESDFESEQNKYIPVIVATILALIVISLYFTFDFLDKKPSLESVSELNKLIFLFTAILMIWALYSFLVTNFVKISNTYYSIIISIAGYYFLSFAPIIYFVMFSERKRIKFEKPQKNQLKPIVLALILCIVSLIILFVLLRIFIQIVFNNDVGDFNFNFNNYSTPRLVFDIIFFFAVVAVVEETVFRWFFAKRFSKLFNFEVGIILSAILFGFMHIPIGVFSYHLNIAEMGVYIFTKVLFGIMLGYFYLKTNSFIGVILWHGLWNSVISNLGFAYTPTNFISWQSNLLMDLLLEITIFFIIISIMVFILKNRKNTDFHSTDEIEVLAIQEEIT